MKLLPSPRIVLEIQNKKGTHSRMNAGLRSQVSKDRRRQWVEFKEKEKYSIGKYDGSKQANTKDGPLSLQDSFNGSNIMYMDTGQTKAADDNAATTNQKSSPPANQNASPDTKLTPNNASSNDSAIVMNGDISVDELINVKNLDDNGAIVRARELCCMLDVLPDYDKGDGMRLVKAIGDLYWNYRAIRPKIGDCLCDSGFGEISMKMLKILNAKGTFKNDSIWFPTYYTMNTLWNFTDASLRLSKAVAEADGVKFFTVNCNHQPYLTNLQNKNVYYMVKASMSIIHNISRNSDVVHYFKENKTQEVMLQFLNAHNDQEMLKIMAMLTLSHIVEEEDNEKLIDETGAIEGTIQYIDKAILNEKRRHRGFTPHELMDGLGKLAVNDKNKKKIIDSGALPVFMKLLTGTVAEEQAITARAIWTLSFDKEVCQEMKNFPDLMPTLEKLKKEAQDKEVIRNVNGALFVLHGENDTSNRPKSARSKNRGHIFLSYSWNEKETVYKIRDKLKAEGYEVWIDIERMGGSTLTAMADAVENAAVVLVCMSEKYKQSPNCRLEAEYTFQLRKDYIPLMMQKKYRPDGWLGAILGAKLYFDFCGKYPFEKPWSGLLKELKGLGRLAASSSPGKDDTDGPIVKSSSSTTYASSPGSLTTSSAALKMSTQDVSNWLCQIKLDGCVPSMSLFDGKLLVQLQKMKTEAPEFYYQCLDRKLNMNLVEILMFTEALEKL